MASPIANAIRQVCEEKNIALETVVETLEAALAAAYRKEFGQANQNIKVEFNPETGDSRVFDVKTVVEVDDEGHVIEEKAVGEDLEETMSVKKDKEQDVAVTETVTKVDEEEKEDPSSKGESVEGLADKSEENVEDEPREPNPKTEIILNDARDIKSDAKVGDEIVVELEVPEAYGRTAAQTAKQVVIQKLREAERDIIFNEYKEREGEVVNAVVQRREGRMVLIDLSKTTALMPPEEQIVTERYRPGDRLKVYLMSVTRGARGSEIVVSRAHQEIVRQLFTVEVPEIHNGIVEIKGIAREPGARSKVAVFTEEENIDPIGACVGQKGSRIQTIISELGGEKIDIIEWSEDPVEYIKHALSPAKVVSVELHEAEKTAVVKVAEDQLSLAIGRSGQNVRLAARLTGWKITLVGEGGKTVESDAPVEELAEVVEGQKVEPTVAEPVEKSVKTKTESAIEVSEETVEKENNNEMEDETAKQVTKDDV